MPDNPKVIHFISNTHWDREWLTNFQETRLLLVDMMDRLLEVLEGNPGYCSYVLDAQTVPLEDYLEARPENRARVVKQVHAGRLLIGPWYTDPEGFSVNGESLVRNLLYGHRAAREYGAVMKVGHTPFGYGQNSQMPQIYLGFGIDTMLFYHGVSHDEVANEFIFEGADGSRILGSQMSSFARYNAYHNLYRGALYGNRLDDRGYSWDQGGLPFRLCREDPAMRHHALLDPVRGWDTELLRESIRKLREDEIAVAKTRHLAFMMGHDSSVPDAAELDIVKETQALFPEDKVKHGHYPELLEAIKAEVDWDQLTVLKGERRTPKPMPVTMHLYSDVLSSRSRMKCLNTKAEYLLQRRCEPFAVAAAQLGAPFPAALIDLAWKELLRGHAHDSIAGSGVDDIERDMMYRLRQAVNLSDGLLRNALAEIQKRIDHSDADKDDVLLTVFNAAPRPRSEVVTVQLDWPGRDCPRALRLTNLDSGEAVPVQLATRRPHTAIVNHPGDAPMNMPGERFAVHIEAKNLPGLGYASYKLEATALFEPGGLVSASNTMENKHLRVRIQPDGTLAVTHKATGVTYENLNYFLDNGEAGHAWMHHNPAIDRVIDSRGFPVSIALEEDGPLLARYRVTCHMEVPARLDENGGDSWQRLDGVGSAAKRSEETRPLAITSLVTLRRGARSVDVTVLFNNTAKHHRLRALFPSRREGTTCHVESAFDVVERETAFSPQSPWYGTKGVTFPQQRFVDVSDGSAGLAIVNSGLREYEVTQDSGRAIALTLMRAFEVALCPVSKCWEELPAMELAQAPGAHEFTYRIYPHAGTYDEGGVLTEADAFTVPIEVAQAGPHKGHLPKRQGFLTVAPDTLVLNAYKRAEDGEGWIIRLHNPTATLVTGSLTFPRPIALAQAVTLEETEPQPIEVKENKATFPVGPKKIVNLRVKLAT